MINLFNISDINFSKQQLIQAFETYGNQAIQFAKSEGWFRCIQHIIVFFVVIKIIIMILNSFKIQSRGKLGLRSYLIKLVFRAAIKISFIRSYLQNYLQTQASKNVQQMLKTKRIKGKFSQLPQQGLPANQILQILDDRVKSDIDPTAGKTFAYVYEQSKNHSKLVQECFVKYMHSNTLNPVLFNSIRVIQSQIIRMSAKLFHGDDNCVGSMTSCGTQSLMLAMKTYRDYRGKGDIIMCTTGHPGINKGCNYVGLNIIQIPYDQKNQMSIKHLKKVISSKTVVVVCSAPSYPHGVMDDVQAIAKVCKSYGVPLHVDSAIGGYIIPFIQMERPGSIKPWDFAVDGVTSINADIHKYGYAPKGSSVLIFNNSRIRRSQFFAFSTWPGGLFIAPTVLGSKNGGTFSSAWGSLLGLGVKGFRQTTKRVLQTRDKLLQFIEKHDELSLVAKPDSSIIAMKTKTFSCFKLADAMQKRGFHVQKQSNPDCLHMTIMPQHVFIVDKLIDCFKESIEQIKSNPELYESGSKATYGMVATIPDEAVTQQFLAFLMDTLYKYQQ